MKKTAIFIGLLVFFLAGAFSARLIFSEKNQPLSPAPNQDSTFWNIAPQNTFETTKLNPISNFRLLFLGTGGPRPPFKSPRVGPSQLVILDSDILLFDSGPGASSQLLKTEISPWKVDFLFFTHVNHFDHVSDYPAFVFTRWLMGATENIFEPLAVFGPKGTYDITRHFFDETYKGEIEERSSRRDWVPLEIREIPEKDGDIVWQNEKFRVKAFHVPHGQNALSYRIETADSILTLSGDIGPIEQTDLLNGFVEFVKGSDVLVMDVQHPTPEQIGFVASQSGVKKLILSHFQDQQYREIEKILAEIRKVYQGEIILTEDLLETKI